MSVPSKQFYLELKLKNKINQHEYISLPVDNIQYLTIKENVLSILPRLEFVFYDSGDLLEGIPILDKDVISVTLSNIKENDALEMEFIISSFSSNAGPENKFNIIKIVGYMYCENMFSPYKTRAIKDNSVNVFKKISDEVNVKFNDKHSIFTKDNMVWYQTGSNYKFINHVLKRSYLDSDSVFFYGSNDGLNITSLNKEMTKEITFRGVYNKERTENFILMEDELDIMYFNSYDVLNLTEIFNNIINYGIGYSVYDLKGSEKNSIISESKNFTDLFNKYKMYDGLASSVINFGFMSNPNVFKDYYKALAQNQFYRYNLFSNTISMNINSSTDVKLFDRVNLGIPSTIFKGSGLNDVYSGDYLVTAITHYIGNGIEYQKQVMLSRNGINKAEGIKEYSVI